MANKDISFADLITESQKAPDLSSMGVLPEIDLISFNCSEIASGDSEFGAVNGGVSVGMRVHLIVDGGRSGQQF